MWYATLSGWKRGGIVGVIVAAGLLASAADFGRTQDPVKIDFPKKSDDKAKSDESKKADEPAKDEPKTGAPSGGAPQTKAINDHFAKFWADNSAKPSRKASDYEFVRRVYLDILGRVPAIWEVNRYAGDPNFTTKKSRLIHRLLHDEYYKEEYEQNWADVWTTLLLSRAGNKTYHEQMHEWLAEQFGKNRPWNEMVSELLTATGENNASGAVNYILAHLGEARCIATATRSCEPTCRTWSRNSD